MLVRPSLRPRDIFYLLAKKIKIGYGLDFIKLRLNAEDELGHPYATLSEIYEFIARKHHLDAGTATALMQEEIRLETTLLMPRYDVRQLYQQAVNMGKRVIAISDMYLPGTVLKSILLEKGLAIDAVYVSCDYKARKSEGTLYDVVVEAEAIQPWEILHIGDNLQSDYEQALDKGFTAVYFPSTLDLCAKQSGAVDLLFSEALCRDPMWSIFLGFSLNRLAKWDTLPETIAAPENLRHFALITLAPLLTAFGLYLATDMDIKSSYKKIYFAARDGWLPHLVYKHIQTKIGGLPAIYFAAGRRAYSPFLYDNFFEYLNKIPLVSDPDSYTMNDLLQTYFAHTPVLALLEKQLPDHEKALLFFQNRKVCLNILRRFEKEIDETLRQQKDRITTYYQSIFDASERRHLVFDLGYAGSIGQALTAITGTATDKVYFWQKDSNRKRDKILATTTKTFMRSDLDVHAPLELMLEELFSPAEGSTIYFDKNGKPVNENIFLSEAHRRDLADIHNSCLEYAADFCSLLGEYASYATLSTPDSALDICRKLLADTPFPNLSLFRNIVFPDPVNRGKPDSLEKKLEKGLLSGSTVAGTGFEDPRNKFSEPLHLRGETKVGLHLHLHYISLAHEIIRYLQDFPTCFDLYLTITEPKYKQNVRTLFSRSLLPKLDELKVLEVPNRGRDVAPWLLTTRPYQDRYELFCHIHGKVSLYSKHGDSWRKYLFDNIIERKAVTDILNIFHEQPTLGCVFPEIFLPVYYQFKNNNVMDDDYRLMCDILRRIGLKDEVCRSELFFSVGTMMWYRPEALRHLFTVNLSFEDFPEEPIPIGGTLAHAIERLPSIVASRNGYLVKSVTRYPSV